MEFDGIQVIRKFFLDERSMMQDFVDYVDMVDPDACSHGVWASMIYPHSIED